MRFDWQNNLHLEDKSQRTHDTKDFPHPDDPNSRIKIQSSSLLHAFTDKGFEDIVTELPDYNFPDGIQFDAEASSHPILTLPTWGDARVEDNGKTVRVYDKLGKSIFVYKNLFAVPAGIDAMIPKSVADSLVADSLSTTSLIVETVDTPVDTLNPDPLVKHPDAVDYDFDVIDGVLHVKKPLDATITYPIQVYDTIDTASANNKDLRLRQDDPTNNQETGVTDDYIYNLTNAHYNQMTQFTLSAGSGTITKIAWFIYLLDAGTNPTLLTWDVNQMTQTAWVETQATWNVYKTGSNWGTAGGDYSATIINSFTGTATTGFFEMDVQGGNATNPLSLTWGNNLDIIAHATNSHNPGYLVHFATREYTLDTAKRPYVEITYTAAGGGSSTARVRMLTGMGS